MTVRTTELSTRYTTPDTMAAEIASKSATAVVVVSRRLEHRQCQRTHASIAHTMAFLIRFLDDRWRVVVESRL